MNFFYFLFIASLSFRNSIYNTNYQYYNPSYLMMKRESKNNKSINNIYHFEEINIKKNLYTPKTENQKIYFKYLNYETNYIIVALGPAGTGKTLAACNTAIYKLKSGDINKIIIIKCS